MFLVHLGGTQPGYFLVYVERKIILFHKIKNWLFQVMCLNDGAKVDPTLCDAESMPASDGDCNTEECVEASGEGSGEAEQPDETTKDEGISIEIFNAA